MRLSIIIKNVLLAVILLVAGYICITDKAAVLGIPQMAYNLIYICVIMPACVGLSDITRWAHPEFYNEMD